MEKQQVKNTPEYKEWASQRRLFWPSKAEMDSHIQEGIDKGYLPSNAHEFSTSIDSKILAEIS